MTKRQYPYAFEATAVELRILNPTDPTGKADALEWLPPEREEEDVQRLDLRSDEKWRELEFDIEARVPRNKLKEILPEGANYREDVSLLLSVRCPSTKLRFPIELVCQSSEEGLWKGSVHVHRADVRSRLELHPLLYRRTSIPDTAAVPTLLARRRFALLGSGMPVVAMIDNVVRNFDGGVRIKWEDFSASANPMRKRYSSLLYYLDPGPDEPVLWLNRKHRQLHPLLFSQSDRGSDAALRTLLAGWLGESIRLQMFHVALGSVAVDSAETGPRMPEGWRGDMLRVCLPVMFPDIESVDDALGRAVEMRQSQDEYGTLVALAIVATQQNMRSHEVFTDSIRAIERSSRSVAAARTN